MDGRTVWSDGASTQISNEYSRFKIARTKERREEELENACVYEREREITEWRKEQILGTSVGWFKPSWKSEF